MELDTLKDLYVDEIKDLYSAEKQLVKALPKMAKAAKDKQLQDAFRTHLRETEQHVTRLERICQELGVSPRGKKCVGMEGLIEEGSERIRDAKPEALDAGLISKAQRAGSLPCFSLRNRVFRFFASLDSLFGKLSRLRAKGGTRTPTDCSTGS